MEVSYKIERTYEWSVEVDLQKVSENEYEATIKRTEIEGLFDPEIDKVDISIEDGHYFFHGSLSNEEEFFIRESIDKHIESNGHCLGNHYI